MKPTLSQSIAAMQAEVAGSTRVQLAARAPELLRRTLEQLGALADKVEQLEARPAPKPARRR